MRKHAKKTRKSAKKIRRLSLTTVLVAIGILAIGAVAIGAVVGSRPKADAVKASSKLERRPAVTNKTDKKFVTTEVGGQTIQVDSQTGQIQELTPEEAQRLAAGIKKLVNKSSDGLESVVHEDGSESVDLKGRFQSVAVAKIDEDGNLVTACFDSPKAVAAFFGIDPKLMETANEDRNQPTRVSPEKNQN